MLATGNTSSSQLPSGPVRASMNSFQRSFLSAFLLHSYITVLRSSSLLEICMLQNYCFVSRLQGCRTVEQPGRCPAQGRRRMRTSALLLFQLRNRFFHIWFFCENPSSFVQIFYFTGLREWGEMRRGFYWKRVRICWNEPKPTITQSC